jgi:hypothetical protein
LPLPPPPPPPPPPPRPLLGAAAATDWLPSCSAVAISSSSGSSESRNRSGSCIGCKDIQMSKAGSTSCRYKCVTTQEWQEHECLCQDRAVAITLYNSAATFILLQRLKISCDLWLSPDTVNH